MNKIELINQANGVLSITLNDILDCLNPKRDSYWKVLSLEVNGYDGSMNILDFEVVVNLSENGYSITLDQLRDLADSAHQIIEIMIIGDSNKTKLKRYETDVEIQSNCRYSIMLIDSSFWEINTSDNDFFEKLKELGHERSIC
jgi:hypothetical protein